MDEALLSRLDGVMALAGPAGGAGRTSLTAGIAATLARAGSETLVVDLDPRASLTQLLGMERVEGKDGGLLQALAHPERALKAVVDTGYPGLSVLPSDLRIPSHEAQLEASLADWRALPRLLDGLRGRFHTIILDLPAGTSRPARAGVASADLVLVPIVTEPLGVRGLPRLLEAVLEAREVGANAPRFAGILLNRVDPTAPFFGQLIGELRRRFGPLLLDTAIPEDGWFVEAAARGMPVPSLLPEAPASRALEHLVEEMALRLT